jgi:phage replication initiation protein
MAKKATSLFDAQVQAYLYASGGVSGVRVVKSEVYGAGKAEQLCAERTASASALPERIGAKTELSGLVPRAATVSGPEIPPINNMGVYLSDAEADQGTEKWAPIAEEDFGEVQLVLSDSGKVKTVMVRRPSSAQACIVDWINFTVLEDTFFKTARQTLVTDDQIIEEASRQFEKVFGFGITEKRDRGMNFYRESWVLGDQMGFGCFGGQRSTMHVTLTGQGCANAISGWEKRLYD